MFLPLPSPFTVEAASEPPAGGDDPGLKDAFEVIELIRRVPGYREDYDLGVAKRGLPLKEWIVLVWEVLRQLWT